MAKFRTPRKKKKAWKKRGIKLILPQELCEEFLAKLREQVLDSYRTPMILTSNTEK